MRVSQTGHMSSVIDIITQVSGTTTTTIDGISRCSVAAFFALAIIGRLL